MAAPTPSPILRSGVVGIDVVTALSFYQEVFLNAYRGYAEPEMVQIGLEDTTSALAYKFPMSVGSSAWVQVTGGVQYDNVGEIMLPISIPPYGSAVCAEVKKLQSDAWTGWGERPGEMAFNARNIGEAALAIALEAGESTLAADNFLDGVVIPTTNVPIFGQDKPFNPLDLSDTSSTVSNLFTSTGGSDTAFAAAPLNLASIDRVANALTHVKGMNGKDFLALKWEYVIVPPQLERQARRYFEDQGQRNDTITESSGTSTAEVRKDNTAKDLKVKVIVNRYLTSATTWYPVCTLPASRKAPWIVVTQIPAHTIPFAGAQASMGLNRANRRGN